MLPENVTDLFSAQKEAVEVKKRADCRFPMRNFVFRKKKKDLIIPCTSRVFVVKCCPQRWNLLLVILTGFLLYVQTKIQCMRVYVRV